MSNYFDVASIEARILSLDATSISILGWLPYSTNDSDIMRRSGSWNYTLAMIEHSLNQIYKAFDIDEITCVTSKRKKAIDMYLAFKNAKYPMTAFSRRGRLTESANSTKIFPHEDKEESDEMDTMDNLNVNRVGTLSDIQLKILEALSEGKNKYVISRDLQISDKQVVDEAVRIFNHLQIESPSLEEKRRIACDLYEDHIAEHGEPVVVEVVTTTPVVPKEAVEVKGEYDFWRLAGLIASLSPRVKEAAKYLAAGLDIPAIAKAMQISESSVQPYASNVYSKLGLHHSLGADRRQTILKLVYEHFVSAGYEIASSVKSREAESLSTTVPVELNGVNITVVAQKLVKLTPRLRELATCLIQNKDPVKELQITLPTLNSYKHSLFSQLGLTGRGLTRKERLRVLEYAHDKIFATTPPVVMAKGTHSNSHALPLETTLESVEIPEQTPPTVDEEASVIPISLPPRTVEDEASSSNETVQQYGQGVPIMLPDPETITDVSVISGRHRVGAFDSELKRKRLEGFHPEVLVVYPTTNPKVSLAQLVLIRRKH
ncbi:MAG: helix-turn-helix transcriptional regulator [Candidatus Pacebacteria bacterium]|nr:helix-turn-helix transcriptional regulator [Candidatus Paceibacterota bacterium]MBP9843025.1 helix-turn-helix transcriptional regulator [Candidatus Paceibacterota bacterium]